MTPIEEFKVRMDRLIAKNESLFAAAVKDFHAQYLEALEATVTKQFHVGPGEVTGPVYVNHIPYVPASEVERLRAALEWYGEQAEATARHTIVINPKALEAIVTALSLDAGGRARAALGQESTT